MTLDKMVSTDGYGSALLFDILGLALLGAMMGGMGACGIALLFTIILALILFATRLDGRKPWVASQIGGWTGFACSTEMVEEFRFVGAQGILAILLAVAMWQIGAAMGARWVLSRGTIEPPNVSNSRFSLKQLLGLTTIAAAIFAGLAAMHLPEWMHVAIALCAIWQAATILLFQAFARWKKSE